MLARYAKAFFTRLFTPIARGLLAAGISPDVVTWIGALGVSAAAFAFFPRGDFFVGTRGVTAFVFSDTIDGTMARLAGRPSRWGAFLDSTLDRVADASVFAALLLWFAGREHDWWMTTVLLVCLIGGMVVSYAKARAEGLGLTANVGIAERSERLVTALVATGLAGIFHQVWIQRIAITALAAATLVTIGQRMVVVRKQVAADGPTACGPAADGPAPSMPPGPAT
jgi:CDP-diacylglycerol---glycerol-3-phosphate 3-phosphatidyltransferase